MKLSNHWLSIFRLIEYWDLRLHLRAFFSINAAQKAQKTFHSPLQKIQIAIIITQRRKTDQSPQKTNSTRNKKTKNE